MVGQYMFLMNPTIVPLRIRSKVMEMGEHSPNHEKLTDPPHNPLCTSTFTPLGMVDEAHHMVRMSQRMW